MTRSTLAVYETPPTVTGSDHARLEAGGVLGLGVLVLDGVEDGEVVPRGVPVELGVAEGLEVGVEVGEAVALELAVAEGVMVGVASGVGVTVGVGRAGRASLLTWGARTPIVPAMASVAAATPATAMTRRRTTTRWPRVSTARSSTPRC